MQKTTGTMIFVLALAVSANLSVIVPTRAHAKTCADRIPVAVNMIWIYQNKGAPVKRFDNAVNDLWRKLTGSGCADTGCAVKNLVEVLLAKDPTHADFVRAIETAAIAGDGAALRATYAMGQRHHFRLPDRFEGPLEYARADCPDAQFAAVGVHTISCYRSEDPPNSPLIGYGNTRTLSDGRRVKCLSLSNSYEQWRGSQ